MRKQNTLKSALSFTGKGLHSGLESRIILKPAPVDTGLVFIYKTHGGNPEYIPYTPDYVVDTVNNIAVSNGKAVVKTVEHLVAALYGMEVDNCLIECSSSEVPIMDGSAREYVDGIESVGVLAQDKDKEELRIVRPIFVTHEDKFIVALPYNGLKLNYTISFPNSPIGNQTFSMEMNADSFKKELSHARTFGFIEDLDYYRNNGLVLGGGFENVHVFSRKENRHLNAPRYGEEPVRHKMLDLVGGLAIMSHGIKGFIISYKGGHYMDVLFARKVQSVLKGERELQRGSVHTADSSYYYPLADWLDMEKLPS